MTHTAFPLQLAPLVTAWQTLLTFQMYHAWQVRVRCVGSEGPGHGAYSHPITVSTPADSMAKFCLLASYTHVHAWQVRVRCVGSEGSGHGTYSDPVTVSTPGNRKASSKAPSARSEASSTAGDSSSTALALVQPGKSRARREASVTSLALEDDFSSVAVTESKLKRKNGRRKPPGSPTLHNILRILLVICDCLCCLSPCRHETVRTSQITWHRDTVSPHEARHVWSVLMHKLFTAPVVAIALQLQQQYTAPCFFAMLSHMSITWSSCTACR